MYVLYTPETPLNTGVSRRSVEMYREIENFSWRNKINDFLDYHFLAVDDVEAALLRLIDVRHVVRPSLSSAAVP